MISAIAAVATDAVDDVKARLQKQVEERIADLRRIKDSMRERNDEAERRARRASREGMKAVK